MEKIWSINEQQMIEIDELYDEIWKLDELIEDLENLINKNKDNYSLESFKEKMTGLSDELECKQDSFIQNESETNETFSDLCSKSEEVIYQLNIKGAKLVKLGEPKTKIDVVKESKHYYKTNFFRLFKAFKKQQKLYFTAVCFFCLFFLIFKV